MKILRHHENGYAARIAELTRSSSLFDKAVEQSTRGILEAIYVRGDAALLEFTEKFDGARLTAEQLPVSKAELLDASLKADETLRSAVKAAGANIERFSRKSLRRDWAITNRQGARVGEKFDPFQRIGIYIPGGTAPLVSTALMTVTLARAAGCKEIVVCTPCNSRGQINAALLFATRHAGATEIYRAGGSQAIAAMAYGTPTIRAVQKVFGPGNPYVVAAKRLLFGYVAVDLLPGPSEVLVLADDSADPGFAAADLLAQAEHGSGHERVWLVTNSKKVLQDVENEIARQLPELNRRTFIEKVLENNGWLIQVENIEAGVKLVNAFAPEHCELMVRNAARVAEQIVTAGAIFIGPWSPTVTGDYMAGPSHTLPTGGAGVSFAGLTVDQFQRRTSVVQYDRSSLRKSIPVLEHFAKMEGLDAHARSATIRLASTKRGRGTRR